MSEERAETRRLRRRMLLWLVILGKDAPDGWVPKHALGERINLDPLGNAKHQATLDEEAWALIKERDVENRAGDLWALRATPKGRMKVLGV